MNDYAAFYRAIAEMERGAERGNRRQRRQGMPPAAAWESTPEARQTRRYPSATDAAQLEDRAAEEARTNARADGSLAFSDLPSRGIRRIGSEEQRQLEIDTAVENARQQARREYSALPDQAGIITPIVSAVADPVEGVLDRGRETLGIPGGREDRIARDRRWARGARQASEDILDEGHGGQLMDWAASIPEAMRQASEIRAEEDRGRELNMYDRSLLRPVVETVGDFWTGMSSAGRDARGEVAAADARRDYASRDWEIANARGDEAFNRGDMQGAGEADIAARSASLTRRIATEEGDQAAGADFWTNAPWALEFAPEFGMVQSLARFPARVGLRAAGQEVPEALARPNLLSETQRPGVRTGEVTPNGEDVLYSATGNAQGWRNNAAAGGGAYLAADSIDGEMGDDPTQNALIAGGVMAAGRNFIPNIDTAIPAEIQQLMRQGEVGADGARNYTPRPRQRLTVDPEGRVAMDYEGSFNTGDGASVGETRSVMRGAREALDRDIRDTRRSEYSWTPNDERQAALYRGTFERDTPINYAFSETPEGTMRLRRLGAEFEPDPIQAQPVPDSAPFGFEGAPQPSRVIDAEATPAVQRNFEAAVRDPQNPNGRPYTGEDHQAAIDSIPDEATRARLQAIYDAPTEDPRVIGFNVNGQFMGREEGLQSLRSQRRPVRVGEQYNVPPQGAEGLGPVTPRDPINWDDPRTRLSADEEEFRRWAGQGPTVSSDIGRADRPAIAGRDPLRGVGDGGPNENRYLFGSPEATNGAEAGASSGLDAGPVRTGFRLPTDIRRPSEDINEVLDANFEYGQIVGNETVSIDSLIGGVSSAENGRVGALARQISGPDGYVERIIVDDVGNVIEGQHRLDALRQLGATEVPIVRVRDNMRNFDFAEVSDAMQSAGQMHSDQVHGLVRELSSALARENGSVAAVRANWEPPRGFAAQWDAGLNAVERRAPNPPRTAPDGGSAREGFDTGRVVYRGLGRQYDPANGGYYQSFTSSLDDAREYGSNVIAAHIRPGRNLAIDGGGNNFNSLSVHQLPADVRARLHPGVGDAATTDQIAHAAREAGYDSVTVRNVHDNRWGERPGRNTPARTIDFVFDTKNISPLDNIPTQPPRAEAAAERVRLSEADRALLAELEDFPDSTQPDGGSGQTGSIRGFHGSRLSGLTELQPGERGPMGPATYLSPNEAVAGRYGDHLYEADAQNIFHGLGAMGDSNVRPFERWTNQVERLAQADPAHAAEIRAISERMQPGDGYPFFRRLVDVYGSDEAVQALFKRAGFDGISGHVDGPEIAIFGNLPVRAQPNAGPRRLGDNDAAAIAGVATTGAAGAYTADQLFNQEANASDGTDTGGNPIVPILGAGASLAALEALRRGRLGQSSRSQVGMFAGVNARTADRAALARAEEMAASGASRDSIWQETGWFQGVDGKWRFEIDDSGANIVRTHNGNAYGNLEDGLNHPELYDAYPEMRETRLGFEGDMRASGSYRAARDEPRGWGGKDGTERVPAEIRARGSNPGSLRSTTLHEVQHGVQGAEGFARGGMPSLADAPLDVMQRISALNRELEEMNRSPPMLRDMERYRAVSSELRTLRGQASEQARDVYNRLSGEVEARNVSTRRNMTPEQRARRAPWETQDVPDDQQIVRFDGDRAESRPRRLGAESSSEVNGSAGARGVTEQGTEGVPDLPPLEQGGTRFEPGRLSDAIMDQIEAAIERGQSVTHAEIARQLGTTPKTVTQALVNIRGGSMRPDLRARVQAADDLLGDLRSNSSATVDHPLTPQIAELAARGDMGASDIGRELGVTEWQIRHIAERNNIDLPNARRFSDFEDRNAGWLADHENGMSFRAIARRENVGVGMVASGIKQARAARESGSAAVETTTGAAQTAARTGVSEDRVRQISAARKPDALDAIAPIAITGAGVALAFGDEAQAQELPVQNVGDLQVDPNTAPPSMTTAVGAPTVYDGDIYVQEFSDGTRHAFRMNRGDGRADPEYVGQILGSSVQSERVGDVYNHAYDNSQMSEPYSRPQQPRRRLGGSENVVRPALAAAAGIGANLLVPGRYGPMTRMAASGVATGVFDTALGGDLTESLPLAAATAGGTEFLRAGARDTVRRLAADGSSAALALDPAFQAQRDAFAQTLPDVLPTARVTDTRNYHGEIQRPDEGLFGAQPITVPDSEMAAQGYAYNRPVENMPSQREQFLDAPAAIQMEWMRRAERNRPSTGADPERVARGREIQRRLGEARPPAREAADPFVDPNSGSSVFGEQRRPRAPRAPLPPVADRAEAAGAQGAMRGVKAAPMREIADDLGIASQGRPVGELRKAIVRELGRRFDSTREMVAFLGRYGVTAAALGIGIESMSGETQPQRRRLN